jgi:hypothetical protein
VSKRYKGKVCVYCGKEPSTTADHVIAREFFLEKRRGDLPKVPACEMCNAEKARLEHYLTTILPFAGRHPDAVVNLETMVPKRLNRNFRLHTLLSLGLEEVKDKTSPLGFASTLPIDDVRLEQLFALIAKGLAWFHWQILLTPGYSAVAAFFLDSGVQQFQRIIAESKPLSRVTGNWGNKTFCYEGMQFAKDPKETFWKLSVYGGACFGDPNLPGEKASQVIAVTGADSEFNDLEGSCSSNAATLLHVETAFSLSQSRENPSLP